jgi:hypothetical protein
LNILIILENDTWDLIRRLKGQFAASGMEATFQVRISKSGQIKLSDKSILTTVEDLTQMSLTIFWPKVTTVIVG